MTSNPIPTALASIISGLKRKYPDYSANPFRAALLWQELCHSFGPLTQTEFEARLAAYQDIFSNFKIPFAWIPTEDIKRKTNINEWMAEEGLNDYRSFHAWSAGNPGRFWKKAVEKLGIRFSKPCDEFLNLENGAENPLWLGGARMNIADSCFSASTNKVAVYSKSEGEKEIRQTSYGELDALSNRVANGLLKAGLNAGDRAALYMPLSLEAIAIYLGIVKAGLAAVLVADSFSAEELRRRMATTAVKILFANANYLYGGKTLDIYQKVKESGAPPSVLIPGSGNTQLRDGDFFFADFLGDATFQSRQRKPDDAINVLFSSGTTQDPKAIPWTHLTPIKCATDGYLHHDIHEDDIVSWTTGMGWMMGPWLIYAALINKASIAIFKGSAATEEFCDFVEKTNITVLGSIPSLVKVWRKNALAEKKNWKVRVFSSTGEPSNAEDYLYLMTLSNHRAPVIEYCGGTEIGGGYITGTLVQPASPAMFTTPALGLDFNILTEDGHLANAGEIGEVFIVPPSIGLSQTLLNRNHHEEYFADCPKNPKGGVPLRRHGDALEHCDGLEFYRSHGRIDDAMNLGGIKVSPVEIEETLNRHPAIFESAAVAARPRDGGPEGLAVFYVPSPKIPAPENLRKQLQDMLSKELNPLFRISQLIPRESLPRTASNKIMRRVLRKELAT